MACVYLGVVWSGFDLQRSYLGSYELRSLNLCTGLYCRIRLTYFVLSRLPMCRPHVPTCRPSVCRLDGLSPSRLLTGQIHLPKLVLDCHYIVREVQENALPVLTFLTLTNIHIHCRPNRETNW